MEWREKTSDDKKNWNWRREASVKSWSYLLLDRFFTAESRTHLVVFLQVHVVRKVNALQSHSRSSRRLSKPSPVLNIHSLALTTTVTATPSSTSSMPSVNRFLRGLLQPIATHIKVLPIDRRLIYSVAKDPIEKCAKALRRKAAIEQNRYNYR